MLLTQQNIITLKNLIEIQLTLSFASDFKSNLFNRGKFS